MEPKPQRNDDEFRFGHVTPKRLAELTRVRTIVEEPEWFHVKTCERCLELFVGLMRQAVQNPDA